MMGKIADKFMQDAVRGIQLGHSEPIVNLREMADEYEEYMSLDKKIRVFDNKINKMLDKIMKQAVDAKITDALDIVDTWAKFHWRKHGGDKIKKIN